MCSIDTSPLQQWQKCHPQRLDGQVFLIVVVLHTIDQHNIVLYCKNGYPILASWRRKNIKKFLYDKAKSFFFKNQLKIAEYILSGIDCVMLLHCNTSYDSLVEGGVNEGKILRQERLNLFYLVDGCWLDGWSDHIFF